MFSKKGEKDIAFEESLEDDWSHDLDIVEVPIKNQPLVAVGFVVAVFGMLFLGWVIYLNIALGDVYRLRAETNASRYNITPAPRGEITDRNGTVLAKNVATFSLILNPKEFLNDSILQNKTLDTLENILSLPRADIWNALADAEKDEFATPIVLVDDLPQDKLVELKALNLPTLAIQSDFKRQYEDGSMFASIVGYVGRVNANDLKSSTLSTREFVGRAGIEGFYDSALRGSPGVAVEIKNAKGSTLVAGKISDPQVGGSVRLTIDAEFEKYFYNRLATQLRSLGRTVGIGLAINPQNGQVLAMVSIPSFDNNILSGAGHTAEKTAILNAKDKPLFDRVVSGLYNPGSTVKPLVGVAALTEGVIDPKREIFSPGYLDVPNPYNPASSTRYLDWRYQGNVNLASAIAQSSNVYFYTVGGGASGIKGLGISKLEEWWKKFGFGAQTGIDLPAEESGFIPSPEWKERKTNTPWLLGDTYNVAIGQGDLLVTPIELVNYITAIANGGKIYKPTMNLGSQAVVIKDLEVLSPQINEVREGMREAVTAPLGTAYLLHDLGFTVGAKTGSAQIKNNAAENALFVGFAPFENPKIEILVLIENAREGSLNAVPVAKDVLNWYYGNRVKT